MTLAPGFCLALPEDHDHPHAPTAIIREHRWFTDYDLHIVNLGAAQPALPDATQQPYQDVDLTISNAAQRPDEIAFVDRNVPDYETLLQHLTRRAEIVFLDADHDGLEQMARVLRSRHGLRAIHVLSHGASGQLQLAGVRVSIDNLADHRKTLRAIGNSLRPDGDILLYGCDVARGNRGRHFIKTLSRLAGVDVAASDDATGSPEENGDWDLEITTGK